MRDRFQTPDLFSTLDLFQAPTQYHGDFDADRELIKVTTSPSGYGPPVPSYSLVVKRHRDDFFIETTEVCEDKERAWRTPLDPREADSYLSRLHGMSVPICAESPTVPDGEYIEITVFGLNARLTLGWWSVPPVGAEYLAELVDWVLRSGTPDDDTDDDITGDRLVALGDYVKSTLLYLDRQSIYEGVIQSMLKDLHDVCAPSESEGIDTGYDFFGLLKTEGSDNFFYQMSMDTLRDDLFSKVRALDDDSQIALLLPLSEDDTDELFRASDISEWASCLRNETAWVSEMLNDVLGRIPARYRHE